MPVHVSMERDIKNKAISGISWNISTRIGGQVLQFGTLIILTRLLEPRDFGLVGMVTVFIGFARIFIDLGFGDALIQRSDADERYFTTVFWVNVIMGIFLSALFFLIAPAISQFYNYPFLVPIARVLAILFFVNSLSVIPLTLFRRSLDFRRLATIEIFASVLGAAVAIVMAVADYGVWSLVGQQLVFATVTMGSMWIFVTWHPTWLFDRNALKDLFSFSMNLIGYRVFDYTVGNIDNMLVGKYLGPVPLGFYSRAYNTMRLPCQVSAPLAEVMFPVLSRFQSDKDQLKRIYLRTVGIIALVTFPVMSGLLVVTKPFVLAFFGNKWSGMIPVLQIFCLLGMAQSIGSTVGWIYNSTGRTDLQLRWGIGSGVVFILSIVLGIWLGSIEAVAICYAVASGIILIVPSFSIPGRIIGMTVGEVANVLKEIVLACIIMASTVAIIGRFLPNAWSNWTYLSIQVPIGILIYIVAIRYLGVKAFLDVKQIVDEHFVPKVVKAN